VRRKVLELAHELKLLKAGTISVDGTNIDANATTYRQSYNTQAAVDADGSQLVLRPQLHT
jgi:hypothetical protein